MLIRPCPHKRSICQTSLALPYMLSRPFDVWSVRSFQVRILLHKPYQSRTFCSDMIQLLEFSQKMERPVVICRTFRKTRIGFKAIIHLLLRIFRIRVIPGVLRQVQHRRIENTGTVMPVHELTSDPDIRSASDAFCRMINFLGLAVDIFNPVTFKNIVRDTSYQQTVRVRRRRRNGKKNE